MPRDYATLESRIQPGDDRARQMESFVETVWPALRDTGVSWIGFYLHESGDALVLGPRRDKPACSPIALHGACGRALTTRRPLVVHDVADLGEEYIACDPRDRSELVIPLFDESGRCWGVLDVDSHAVGAFDDTDVAGFQRLLLKAGLTAREPE
ncbi:MAG: GAF domain-containing protein [Phycisphaerae bacterium]